MRCLAGGAPCQQTGGGVGGRRVCGRSGVCVWRGEGGAGAAAHRDMYTQSHDACGSLSKAQGGSGIASRRRCRHGVVEAGASDGGGSGEGMGIASDDSEDFGALALPEVRRGGATAPRAGAAAAAHAPCHGTSRRSARSGRLSASSSSCAATRVSPSLVEWRRPVWSRRSQCPMCGGHPASPCTSCLDDEHKNDVIPTPALCASPQDVTSLDPQVLSTLPTSVQLEILEKMRDAQNAGGWAPSQDGCSCVCVCGWVGGRGGDVGVGQGMMGGGIRAASVPETAPR